MTNYYNNYCIEITKQIGERVTEDTTHMKIQVKKEKSST